MENRAFFTGYLSFVLKRVHNFIKERNKLCKRSFNINCSFVAGFQETKVVPDVVVSRHSQGEEEDVVLQFFRCPEEVPSRCAKVHTGDGSLGGLRGSRRRETPSHRQELSDTTTNNNNKIYNQSDKYNQLKISKGLQCTNSPSSNKQTKKVLYTV